MARFRRRLLASIFLWSAFVFLTFLLLARTSFDVEPPIASQDDADAVTGKSYADSFQQNIANALNFSALNCHSLVTSELHSRGPIDVTRTELLRQQTRVETKHVWNQGQVCGCRRQILDYFLDAPQFVSADMYWQEVMLTRSLVSLSHRNYNAEASRPNSVALLTQMTRSRVDMLDLIADRWAGPIVAAVYVKPSSLLKTYNMLCERMRRSGRQNIMLHLVLAEGELYPVNWLRNLVIQNSSSEYVFMIDSDFVPSAKLESELQRHFRRAKVPEASDSQYPVFIVPAFEILDPAVKRLPRDKEELMLLIESEQADVFHRRLFAPAHDVWQFESWRLLENNYDLANTGVCSPKAEPYMALLRRQSPLLPETLLERGKNKAAYYFELCTAGAEFTVLANEFLIHKYHPSTATNLLKVRDCVFASFDVFMDHTMRKYNRVTSELLMLPFFSPFMCRNKDYVIVFFIVLLAVACLILKVRLSAKSSTF